MKIYLGTDHAGFELKEKIKEYLTQEKYDILDCGNQVFDENDDYPDFISVVAENVAKDVKAYGIVFGKSGAGECMVANKHRGTRAFLAINEENVRLAREHNNANIICFGSDFIGLEQAKQLVKLFLEIPFSREERHARRIDKIKQLEDKFC
jgi:ribose 5-phosphate isomerase B